MTWIVVVCGAMSAFLIFMTALICYLDCRAFMQRQRRSLAQDTQSTQPKETVWRAVRQPGGEAAVAFTEIL